MRDLKISLASNSDGIDSRSSDLGAYHFTGTHQEGFAMLDSFDNSVLNMPSRTAQLAQSYGSPFPFVQHTSSRMSKSQRSTRLPQVLTWRLDPDESLSDWTLTVVSNPDLEKETADELDASRDDSTDDDDEHSVPEQPRRHVTSYHPAKKYFVHRTQLALGPRRSEYFSKLFRKKQKKSTGTRIELRPSAAAAFPAMLDFLYSPVGTPPNTTTENAVALRYLATCFGIRELFETVTEFIKLDLSPETAPTYLLEASACSHLKLQSAALKKCAENFESIKFSRIVTLTPELLEDVVTSPLLQVSSHVLSSRIASYCRCRPGLVDATMLQRLTHPDRMPEVAPEESLFFLHLIFEIEECEEEESVGGRSSSGKHSLYKRCLDASTDIVRLAIASRGKSKKKSSDHRSIRNAIKEYHSLPASMRVDLLEHALQSSPTVEDLHALDQARKEAKQKHLTENNEQVQKLQAEMEKMRRKYEKKLASQEARISTQEQEIAAYAKELSKFVRVPNDHPVPETTQEHTYAHVPEFNEYGEALYGSVAPTAVPRFGTQQQEDGWVYHESRWHRNGHRSSYCWPVYFYKGE